MPHPIIITLTTDFGLSDPFVGIMKGVILGIAPNAQLVDISHEIPSYSVSEAAFVVETSYRYFPAGTVHLVVVDPGVGSARRPLVSAAHGQLFIGPDNGVLSAVLDDQVYHLTNTDLFLKPVSRTFHGRDIFAPSAAHFAKGMPVESAGPRILDFIKNPLPQPLPVGGRLLAKVMRVDKFGNLITNLHLEDLGSNFTIRVAGVPVTRLCRNFSEAGQGEFFAFEGSTGYIEIALNQGAAANSLNVGCGLEIEVESDLPNH